MMIYAKQAAQMNDPWKLWEIKSHDDQGWFKPNGPFGFVGDWEFRQIPKTIRIGNFDVPEPMREKPKYGTSYYFVEFGNDDFIGVYDWRDDKTDNRLLDIGICHLTRENCVIHAKALFSFTEVR